MTYQERVARYRVVRHEIITDPQRRAEYVINGLDPDQAITLQYSFDSKEEAEAQLLQCREIEDKIEAEYGPISWHHYILDGGEAEVVTRQSF